MGRLRASPPPINRSRARDGSARTDHFADLIRAVPADTLAIICERGAESVGDVIRRLAPRAIVITTGPEGDFDSGELASAHAAGSSPPTRTESAPQ